MKNQKIFEVGTDFDMILKKLSVIELIAMTNDLERFPEDINFLRAVQQEIKQRAKGAHK